MKNEDVFSFFHRTLKQLEEQFFPLNLPRQAAYQWNATDRQSVSFKVVLNSVTHHRRYQVQFVK